MSSEQAKGGGVADQASDGGGVLGGAVEQLDRELATFKMVEERLVEAWGYLLRMPDREKGWHRLKASWPDMRRHHHFGDYGDMDADARPKQPGLRTAEVDRMEEALGWVEWVAEQHRPLIGIVLGLLQRHAEPEWVWIAREIGGVAPDACRMRYNRAVTRICERLNAAEIRR